MSIFAIETSGAVGSVALGSPGEDTEELLLAERARHGSSLAPACRELLARAGRTMGELSAVGVGLGPGSYTGMRIGLSFAKTLAFALRLPLVGHCGLAAIATDHGAPGEVVAVVEEGHRAAVYGAAYELGSGLPKVVVPAGLWQPAELLARLPDAAVLVGGAASRLGGARPRAVETRVRAATLVLLTGRHLAAGLPPDDQGSLEPLYLQASAPERLA